MLMIKNRGQVALVVVLAMVVLLTIGLSVISRTVTDIRISKETEESTRAFSAAEAGIEEALEQDLGAIVGEHKIEDILPEVDVTYNVEEIKKLAATIGRNDTAEVKLEGYGGDYVKINWENAGLELALLYYDGGDGEYKVARYLLKQGIACGEGFDEVSLPYSLDLSGYDEPRLLRVRPLCASTTVTVEGDGGYELPAQSYKIRSQAKGPGGETRVLEVTKSLPILPPVFDYVLFSGGGIQ